MPSFVTTRSFSSSDQPRPLIEPCSQGMLLISFPAQLYMSILGFDDLPVR